MYGNLKVFSGQIAFDSYAEHLREFGEPILPYEGLLWIVRVVLLVSVVVHVAAAITLTRRNRAAAAGGGRQRYYSDKAPRGVQRSYASMTMRWGGVILLVFIAYHLLHLTANVIAPGGASSSPYERVVNGFEIWWVTLSYVVAMAAVGLHLRHGIWSALTTLGANTSERKRVRLNQLAIFVATAVTVGFLLPPLAIFFGLVD
jgi:succinate dehydrogenase / fumarate reductase cytochrome b subunit